MNQFFGDFLNFNKNKIGSILNTFNGGIESGFTHFF